MSRIHVSGHQEAKVIKKKNIWIPEIVQMCPNKNKNLRHDYEGKNRTFPMEAFF